MEGRGCRNVKRERTSKEASASASSEVGDHADDLMMERSSKNHQSPATKSASSASEEAQAAGSGKKTKEKRKKVVRDRIPEMFINFLIVESFHVYEIPDEKLAKYYSEEDRASYAERKARTEKLIAHNQALIDQYLINGYAESVWEVTDDEDDGDDTEAAEKPVSQ